MGALPEGDRECGYAVQAGEGVVWDMLPAGARRRRQHADGPAGRVTAEPAPTAGRGTKPALQPWCAAAAALPWHTTGCSCALWSDGAGVYLVLEWCWWEYRGSSTCMRRQTRLGVFQAMNSVLDNRCCVSNMPR